MFGAVLLIFFIQVSTFYIQPTIATCTANIPNCRTSRSTALYCTPIVPSVPQFFGMKISGCTVFSLQNEWALSSMPKETITRFRGVQAIHLNKGGLSYLPCDLFYHMKDDLRSVYLSYNHFETIQNCTFRNLEHLETLDLTNNRVSKLDDFLFYTLPSLQRIDMGHNTISEISPRVFQAVNRSSLENVNLSFNKISVIEGGVFTNLKLKILELSDNGLKHIHKEFISTSRRTIQTLNLRRNSLTDELWGALEGLINLKTMYLDGNLLTTVKPDVFNHLSNIQYIVLSKNQIQEVKDVRMRSGNLHFISLSYNNVSLFDTDVFSPTQTFSRSRSVTIDLSFNGLQTLHLRLPPCNKTCDIKLQNNRLKKLTFSDSTRNQLNTIDVRNNQLVKLSDSFPYSKYYYLSNNPLSTETALRFLDKKLKASYKLYMSNVSMFCSSSYVFSQLNPEQYMLTISSLSFLDLSNNCIKDEFVCSLIYNSSKQISINLDRNYISSVPECMVIVPRTISLSLQSNRISDINLNNIRGLFFNLNLNGNLITNLDRIVTLGGNEDVTLRNNKLEKLNDISVGFNLQRYYFSDNIHVDVSNNGITELKTINLTFLYRYDLFVGFNLNVSSNSLSKLPNIISDFQTDSYFSSIYMTAVYIFSNNNLRNISTIYFKTSQIMHYFDIQLTLDIHFDNNDIDFIVEPIVFLFTNGTNKIFHHSSSISYNFAFNMFKSYPSCAYFLQTDDNQQHRYSHFNMDLSHNKLSQIPDFDNITACYLLLIKFDLSYNQIQNINHNFTSTSINSPSLINLNLSYNKLKFIVPYAFNSLTNLQTLDLSVNSLQIITKGLELMIIRYLNFSHNMLTMVPSVITNMKYLNQLDVSYNNIVKFEAEFGFYVSLNLTGNELDCSCSNAWIRNNRNYIGDGRCSTPHSSKGYLLKCYPIAHCNEKYLVYPTWEVQSQCYNDRFIGILIKQFESLDHNLTVVWETFGPFSPFGYFVMLIENGTIVFTSKLLDSHVTSYIMFWENHADQICIQALKKDTRPHFLKCIDTDKFNLTHHSEITKVNQGSVTIIILAVLLSISTTCLILFVLVIKFRTCICNCLNMRFILNSKRNGTTLSNNPDVSDYEMPSGVGQQNEMYEDLNNHEIPSSAGHQKEAYEKLDHLKSVPSVYEDIKT